MEQVFPLGGARPDPAGRAPPTDFALPGLAVVLSWPRRFVARDDPRLSEAEASWPDPGAG
jgi:hypothetical protein